MNVFFERRQGCALFRQMIARVALLTALILLAAIVQSPVAAQPVVETRDIYFDNDGLIIHKKTSKECADRPISDINCQDGGDTSQREGWYWVGVWIRSHVSGLQPWQPTRALNFDQVLGLLEPKKEGVFYRHPKLAPWNNPHGKEYGTSRDQLVPLIAAMGLWGKTDELRRLWDALPESLLGKHAFNGDYRNFLGQDGPNCMDIKKRGCDATADCSLKVDSRDCSLKTDNRDCSLAQDTRDCSLKVDTRSCGHDIEVFGIKTHVNDPICEAGKAGQNVAYAAEKAACETAKAAQNAAYKAAKDSCELGKASQNVAYKAEKDACEAGKAGQNAAYVAEKAACETAKTTSKAACEAQKAVDTRACMVTNVHSGDLFGPMAVNLYRRAMNESPLLPVVSTLPLPPVNMGTGPLGEAELAIDLGLRMAEAATNRDEVGKDLNAMIMVLMAKLRFGSVDVEAASKVYAETRPHSYGSYLSAYRAQFGNDSDSVKEPMNAGIASGWKPETSRLYGAIKWYHRAESGANPQLAEMYAPILEYFFK